MSTPSPAKFCLNCGASQTKAAPASLNCISCNAEIPDFAKFCQECGTTQNRQAAAIQEDESAVAAPRTPEMSSSAPEDSTVSGIESQASGNLLPSSAATNQASNPTEATAQYILGMMRQNRIGNAKDEAKAADRGDVDAQFNLGVMYENGQGGLAKDDAQALSWYQKAADQGDAEAQANSNRLKQESENADKPKNRVSAFDTCAQPTKTPSLVASTAYGR